MQATQRMFGKLKTMKAKGTKLTLIIARNVYFSMQN